MSLNQTNTLDEPAVDAGAAGTLNLLCKGTQSGGGIQWRLTLPDGANGNSVEVPERTGPWNVNISLRPPEGSTVAYRVSDPMWAGEVGCPPPRGINTQQISNVNCPNPMTLTFSDANSGSACDVTYQLNFSDGSSFDPVLRNGGGR